MSFNPFALALDAQTKAVESLTDATRKAEVAPERLGQMAAFDIGETPSEVAYEENKLELLHYDALTEEQNDVPILIVYALINRPEILDLQPDRSVVRRLLEGGHDVYLIDWNKPSLLDQTLDLSDYIDRYIDNCVDAVRDRSGTERINILGYCMGGAMSAVYTSLYPEKVNALGLMAAGLCFDDTGGMLEQWGDDAYYDPRDVVETFGNAPAPMLDEGFALMDPVANHVSKYVSLYDNLENEAFVENFARMELWLNDGVDVAGGAYAEFLEKFYQGNHLFKGELEIGGRPIDVENIQVPLLQILGEYDHLIPPEASRPFNDIVGTDDITVIEHPTGHIGLSVSRSSHETVWPEVAEWYHEVSAGQRGDGGETAMETAAEESETGMDEDGVSIDVEGTGETGTDDRDLEAIDGIGPTYATRLREAGIENPADLAGYSAADIADITDASESQADEWLAQC